jgi:hypothetical protein
VAAFTPDTDPIGGPAPDLEHLLAGLRDCDDPAVPLQEAIDRYLEVTGIDAAPTVEQRAILGWLDAAHGDWVSRYPLAQPLAGILQKIRPLAAALALVDPNFTQPGAHPLHQLLDRVVSIAIGWHPETGRADALEKLVEQATEAACAWFEDRETALAAVCESFTRDSERERNRALRMARRSVEAEHGRARTGWARQTAARLINDCLADNPVPAAIGELLTGPWYASAQLILLKFGESSKQWATMSETTVNLLYSLQPLDDASQERRQKVFDIVAGMPREIRRWLLSLHHDTDALEDAVGLVEYAHLRVLRQEELEREAIPPIETGEDAPAPCEHPDNLRTLKPGQWFLIRLEEATSRRLQLSLNLHRQQQLLFTDYAGLKALQLSYAAFEQLMARRLVKKLPHEVSFSECLARAAGIDSVDALKQLLASAEREQAFTPELPMGAWLGFHDGETPLLARVAVHDPQRDVYIFVNREGIKLREVSRPELRSLMQQGLVEVLESKSTFQEQVRKAREQPTQNGEEA